MSYKNNFLIVTPPLIRALIFFNLIIEGGLIQLGNQKRVISTLSPRLQKNIFCKDLISVKT